MAPPKGSNVDQQLGRLAEAVENSKEDRAEMARRMEAALDRLGGDIRNQDQTIRSTASQVALLCSQNLGPRMERVEIALEKCTSKMGRYDEEACDRRLRVLEADLRYYKAILGTGWGVIWRVGGFVFGSATVAAFVQQFFHRLTGG